MENQLVFCLLVLSDTPQKLTCNYRVLVQEHVCSVVAWPPLSPSPGPPSANGDHLTQMLCAGICAQAGDMSAGHFQRQWQPFLSGTAATLFLGADRLLCLLLVLQSSACGYSAFNEHADGASI